MLSTVLTANGGDILTGVDLDLEGVPAKASVVLGRVGGSGDVEVLKVQAQVADVVAALVDGVGDGVLVLVVSVGVVFVADVGAVLVDLVAGFFDSEDAADAETDGASAGRGAAFVAALGLSVASAVAVGVAGARAAQGGSTATTFVLELDNVEQ